MPAGFASWLQISALSPGKQRWISAITGEVAVLRFEESRTLAERLAKPAPVWYVSPVKTWLPLPFIAAMLVWTDPAAGAAVDAPSPFPVPTAPVPGPGGHFACAAPTAVDHYYLLQRSSFPAGPWESVRLQPGTGSPVTLTDPASTGRRAFYRIAAVPWSAPLDSDGDGLNDAAEWQSGSLGNPFNPAPAPAPDDAAIFMTDPSRYETLAHRDNFPGAAGVREVKFLITGADTRRPRLYFLNTNVHQYHYFFATGVLGYTSDLSTFNDETYFTDGRKQLAGSLIYYPHYTRQGGGAEGLYAIEFWPSDSVGYQHVRMAWRLVSTSLPWMERRLAYHPAGITQEQRLASEAALWQDSAIDHIFSRTAKH